MKLWAEYEYFHIASEVAGYRLTVQGYNTASTAGDSLITSGIYVADGMAFTTSDVDNDNRQTNCAVEGGGAWWHNNCKKTFPTGKYAGPGTTGAHFVRWDAAYGEARSFKTMEFKIRPI